MWLTRHVGLPGFREAIRFLEKGAMLIGVKLRIYDGKFCITREGRWLKWRTWVDVIGVGTWYVRYCGHEVRNRIYSREVDHTFGWWESRPSWEHLKQKSNGS